MKTNGISHTQIFVKIDNFQLVYRWVYSRVYSLFDLYTSKHIIKNNYLFFGVVVYRSLSTFLNTVNLYVNLQTIIYTVFHYKVYRVYRLLYNKVFYKKDRNI
jgi:hypothetical protein